LLRLFYIYDLALNLYRYFCAIFSESWPLMLQKKHSVSH
jgi:hypothetical protein